MSLRHSNNLSSAGRALAAPNGSEPACFVVGAMHASTCSSALPALSLARDSRFLDVSAPRPTMLSCSDDLFVVPRTSAPITSISSALDLCCTREAPAFVPVAQDDGSAWGRQYTHSGTNTPQLQSMVGNDDADDVFVREMLAGLVGCHDGSHALLPAINGSPSAVSDAETELLYSDCVNIINNNFSVPTHSSQQQQQQALGLPFECVPLVQSHLLFADDLPLMNIAFGDISHILEPPPQGCFFDRVELGPTGPASSGTPSAVSPYGDDATVAADVEALELLAASQRVSSSFAAGRLLEQYRHQLTLPQAKKNGETPSSSSSSSLKYATLPELNLPPPLPMPDWGIITPAVHAVSDSVVASPRRRLSAQKRKSDESGGLFRHFCSLFCCFKLSSSHSDGHTRAHHCHAVDMPTHRRKSSSGSQEQYDTAVSATLAFPSEDALVSVIHTALKRQSSAAADRTIQPVLEDDDHDDGDDYHEAGEEKDTASTQSGLHSSDINNTHDLLSCSDGPHAVCRDTMMIN